MLTNNDPITSSDIWLLPMVGERKPSLSLGSRYGENSPWVSPDCRWIAYVSDDSGTNEVYVNTFPRAGNPVRISTTGGTHPVWRNDGKELYYIARDRQMMAATLQVDGEGIAASARRPLFDASFIDTRDDTRPQYAVLGSGERFIVNAMTGAQTHRNISVVLSWPALLKN